MRGIIGFARSLQVPWMIRNPADADQLADLLEIWRVDGIIAHIRNHRVLDVLADFHGPVINTSFQRDDVPYPRVGVQDQRIGRLAAQHLIQRGFRHFGAYALGSQAYARTRLDGFAQAVIEAGFGPPAPGPYVDPTRLQAPRWWANMHHVIEEWLKRLPRPAAIFCANDNHAARVSHVCFETGIRVPEEIALVGVDDDPFYCNICDPALTSIQLPVERVGHEAACLLDRMLHGNAPPAEPILLPPLRVVTRPSSDIFAVEDPVVADALHLIRRRVEHRLTVEQLLEELSVSRRSLEYKFQAALGRTPLAEIHRQRLERARELLLETDLPLQTVAERSGYATAARLCTVFRQHMQISPAAWRQTYRTAN
ncbi:MAG: substrate-binding domain-containing protein [Planctomycetota bacterium]